MVSIGFGLFLGLIAIAAVILYGFTRDRWRWKRIAFGAAAAVLLAMALAMAAIAIYTSRLGGKRADRIAAERERYQVSVHDSFAAVVQRQGVADTILVNDDRSFVAVYWPEFRGPESADKAFFFGPDSLLIEIRFIEAGAGPVEYEWMPLDGVTLGIGRDSVELSLGPPCSEDINSERTLLEFSTATSGVLRFTSISHGAQRVIRHGWYRGTCPS